MDCIMNKYETIMIIDNTIAEEQKKEVIKRIEEYISKNGKITKVETLGTRKLAYEIKGHLEGYYHIINFEAEPKIVAELERIYRITDAIMKFMTIREED